MIGFFFHIRVPELQRWYGRSASVPIDEEKPTKITRTGKKKKKRMREKRRPTARKA